MPESNLTETLSSLGLNRYEAAVYLALVRSPGLTASQVATRSHVPRQRVYDVLGELCRKGLVGEKAGKQRSFIPMDPAVAFPGLLRDYKRRQGLENEDRARAIKQLVGQLRPDFLRASPGNGTGSGIRLLSDPERLAEELGTLADQANIRVQLVCLAQFPPIEAVAALTRAAERVPFQALFGRASVEEPAGPLLAQLAQAGAEIRLTDETVFPLGIFDGRTTLFGDTHETLASACELREQALAQFIQRSFESYWSRAVPYEAFSEKPFAVLPGRRVAAGARDRLLEAMQLGHPSPVPASWIGGGIWTLHHSGHTFSSLIGRPQEMAQAYIEAFERTGNPIIFVGSGYNVYQLAPFGAKIQFRVVGHLDLEQPLVRDADELDAFDVNALADEPAIQTVWEAARIVSAEIGEQALVAATAWAPFNLAAHILGIETMTRGLYRSPAKVEKALAFAARVIKRFYEPLLAEKVIPLVSLADTIAGDHVSRAHFARFAQPYLKDVISWAKAQDALVLLHLCSSLNDKLDLVGETGADCLSLDSRVNLRQAKQVLGSKVCLAGNIDPVGVLDHLTAKEVEAAARECLMAGATEGGFILMPGCDLPPTVSLDNVRAMLRSAEMWQ